MVRSKTGFASKKTFSAMLLVIIIFSTLSVMPPSEAQTVSWSDDFPGPTLDAKWVQGWTGQASDEANPIRIRPSGGGIYAYTYTEVPDGEFYQNWHGPYIRAKLTPFSDFDITGKFRCITLDSSEINRLLIRILDSDGNQIYAFGWNDLLVSKNIPEIAVYGSSDSALIYTTGEVGEYSNFYDREIRFSQSGSSVSFYIDGAVKYTGTTSQNPASYIEVAFLKLLDDCTIDEVNHFDLKRISVTTSPASIPGLPQNLSGIPGNGFAALSWFPPVDSGGLPITGYKIYRGDTAGSETYLTTVAVAVFNDTGLTNGKGYHYRVSAFNALGEGGLCQAILVVPMTVPGAPSGLSAFAGSDFVQISWNPPLSDGGSGIIGYRIYRSLDNIPQHYLLINSSLKYNDTAVTNSQIYYYWVAAINKMGEGSLSDKVLASIGSIATTPSEPRNLATVAGDAFVNLTWSAPLSSGNLPLDGYRVYRGDNIGDMSLRATVFSATAYDDSSVINGQTYVYHVTAFNFLGESLASENIWAAPKGVSLPSEPMNLTIVTGNHSATLAWEAPAQNGGSTVLGYKVYRGNYSGAESLIAELSNVFTYLDTGLANNKVYFYKITAFSALGEGLAANGSAKTPQSTSWDENTTDDTIKPSSWTDTFTLTSSIVTVILMIAGVGIAYLFMRGDGKPPENTSTPESPDNTIDDEPEGDGSDEEEEDK